MSDGVRSPYEFRKFKGRWQRRRVGDKAWSRLVIHPGEKTSRPNGQDNNRWEWKEL